MKKLTQLIILLLFSGFASAQVFTQANFNFGNIWLRGSFDSTLYYPTGCGTPSGTASLLSSGAHGTGQKLKKAALYYDSCGHVGYIYDPSTSTWITFGSGGGSAVFLIPYKQIAFGNISGIASSSTALTYDPVNFNFQGGFANSISGAAVGVTAIGYQNTAVDGFGTILLGHDNLVNAGSHTFNLLGSNNSATNNAGNTNILGDLNSSTYGSSNNLLGQNNKIVSFVSFSTIMGDNNLFSSVSPVTNLFAFGSNLHVNQSNQFYIGLYNDTTRTNIALGIGNGTSNVARSNLWWVDLLGTIFSKPNTTANRPASPVFGMIRPNSDSLKWEFYNGTSWLGFGSGGTGGFSDPLTTNGDLMARISGITNRLPQGTNGQYLSVSGGLLQWLTPPFVPTSRTITVNGTGLNLTSDPTFTVTDANLSTSNVTTNNVSTSKHGFAPILPNDATKFLNGIGTYTVPGVGAIAYSALSDVVITSIAANQLTHWNAGTSKWNNFTPGASDVNGWLGYTAYNGATNPNGYLSSLVALNLYPRNGLHARNDSVLVWGTVAGLAIDTNTTINGGNAFPVTFDNFQSASGRGFRVNFTGDARGDMFYRDVNGFWNRIAVGSAKQHLTGGTDPVWRDTATALSQGNFVGRDTASTTITSGASSSAVTGSNEVLFNPAATINSYGYTLPATAHTGNYFTIMGGGTLTSGVIINTLTVGAPGGFSINGNAADILIYGQPWVFKLMGTVWYRLQ